MKYLIIIFLLLCSSMIQAQFELGMDTVKLDQTPQSGVDSVDVKFAEAATVFDGGLSVAGSDLNASNVFDRLSQRWLLDAYKEDEREYFSALPYMGFTYSFGGQGTQYLTARYSQAFRDSIILNINYRRASGNGYFRNSIFDRNNVRLSLIKKGKFYSFKLKGLYSTGNYQHSGGLRTDTLIETFGIEFSPVFKENAESKYRAADIVLSNYFDVIPSEATATGIVHRLKYSIVNRKYSEIDTLSGIYPIVNFNSDTTSDQYNLPTLSNFGGVFIHRKNFYFDGGVHYAFWDYQNLVNRLDTSEFGLSSILNWKLYKFSLKNDFSLNLFGRFNEWYDHASIEFAHSKFNLNAWMNIGQYALDPFKRLYIGNNFDYTSAGSMKEFILKVGGLISTKFWKDQLVLKAGVEQFASPDLYVYSGNEWQNDSLNSVSITSVNFSQSLRINHFNLDTRVLYNVSNTDYIPSVQLFGRMFYSGRLFEAKILQLAVGADFRYNSSYDVMSFVPGLDVATVGSVSNPSSARTNMDAFLNFGLDRFSFYFRYENIAYFWEDKLREEAEFYPIAAPRIRIGLTWDFFN